MITKKERKDSAIDFSLMDDNDIKVQIYKIILKYAYSQNKIYTFASNQDELDDFISYAYTYFLEDAYKNYDPEKASLSTYIYSTLDYQYKAIMMQAKYHVDRTTARNLVNKTYPNRMEKLRSMFCFRDSIDWCDSSVYYGNPEDNAEKDLQIKDSALASEVDYIKEFEIKEGDKGILDLFNKSVRNFCNNHCSENPERNASIIKERFLSGATLQSLGDKYGLTRERVRQICNSYIKYAKKCDKDLINTIKAS